MDRSFEILIVDDDMGLALNLKDILEEQGYNTAVAHDGKGAIDICRERPFDMALIDFKMPDMSGLKVVEKMAKVSPNTDCIVITAHATLDSAIGAVMQEHIVSYETKPLDIDRLLTLIGQIFKRQRTEEVLEESEKRLKDFMESAIDGFMLFDSGLNLFDINKAMLDIIGLKREEHTGKNITDVVPDIKKTGRYDEHMEVIRTGEPLFIDEMITHPKLGDIYLAQKAFRVGDGLGIITRDITEQKRAEEALRVSEARYKDLYDNAPDMFCSVDAKTTKITQCNKILATSLGYTKEEIIGRPIFNMYHSDCLKVVKEEIFPKFIETGEIHDAELQLKRKDGSKIDVSLNVSAAHDENGNICFSRSVWRDITERKIAEGILRESEERYRGLFENISSGVAVYEAVDNGEDYIIKEFNNAGEKIDHLERKDVIGLRLTEKFPAVKEFGLFEALQRVWRTGKPEFLPPALYKDKRLEGWRENWVYKLPSGEIVVVYDDITERKRAEDKIREINDIINRSPVVAFLWRNDEGWPVEFVSDNVKDVFGYSAENFLTGEVIYLTVIHPEDMERVVREVVNAGNEKGTKVFAHEPYRIITKGGQIKWLDDRTRIVTDESGKITNYEGIVLDITDRIRAEKKLKQYSHELGERVKELNCLYDISKIIEKKDISFNETIQGIVEIIPLSFQYPEIICARIIFNGQEFRTENFRKTKWITKSDIIAYGERKGVLEVFCLEKTNEEDKGKFVKEERKMINAISERLSRLIEFNLSEESLRKSEKKWRTLFERSKDVVYISTLDGRFLDINTAGEELFGYTRDELLKLNIVKDIYYDPDVRIIFKKKIVKEEFVKDFEIIFKRKDGSPIDSLSTATVMRDDKGHIIGYQGIIRDITDRKKIEEDLKDSAARLNEAQQVAHIGSWDIDYSTNDSTYNWSDEMYRIFNQTPETFTPTHDKIMELIHPDDQEDYINILIENLQKRQKRFTFEHRIINPDGSIRYIKSTGNVVYDKKGIPVKVSGIAQDITEWKNVENQLIQTEKLSSLGGILSGVAHELNSPLTSIIGNAQLLQRKDLSGEIKDKLEVIQKESMRCTKIVGGLLAFAREHKSEKKMISINDVVVEAYKLREYELRVNDVGVRLDLLEDVPNTFADPYQLQQVFLNLINNAHDVLKEKGGGVLNIRSYMREETIILEFEDTGPGIPRENMNKIFDPFFTTKDVGEGTGLGLSIIYGIINEHGGKIYVESELDKGAKFTIELPIVKGIVEEEENEIERPKKPEGTITVLVVEDENSLRNYISEMLSIEGYVVDIASNGEEAIKLLEKNEYDAMISDMKMPGMSGQNLYTFVHKEYPELTDKILFMTGDVLGKETQNFLKITEAEYIEKPFKLDEFLNKISNLLSD